MLKTYILIVLIISISKACDLYNYTALKSLPDRINCETLFNSGTKRGQGSFGQVNTINYLGKNLAIKKIKLAKNLDLQKFKRKYKLALHEINILKTLTISEEGKKFFPEFYGCGIKGNAIKGPMEVYVIQEVLYKDLQKDNAIVLINNVPAKDRIRLYLELAQGLAFLHQHDYVHADLKPENMMTNLKPSSDFENLHFKIIDLGMTDTVSNYVMGGSPIYNSPEKINGDTYNKFSHDVWAFGLTVAAIEAKSSYIFDRIPDSCFLKYFGTTCANQLLTKVGGVMNTVYGAGSEFGRIVKSCLVLDAKKRIGMADIVGKIEKILKDEDKLLEGDDMTTTVNKKDNFKLKGTVEEIELEKVRIANLNQRAKDLRDQDGILKEKVLRYEKVKKQNEILKQKKLNQDAEKKKQVAAIERKKQLEDKKRNELLKDIERKKQLHPVEPKKIKKYDNYQKNNFNRKIEEKKAGKIDRIINNVKAKQPFTPRKKNIIEVKKREVPEFIDHDYERFKKEFIENNKEIII